MNLTDIFTDDSEKPVLVQRVLEGNADLCI